MPTLCQVFFSSYWSLMTRMRGKFVEQSLCYEDEKGLEPIIAT